MSTKIHHGLRFVDADFFELDRKICQLRNEVTAKVREKRAEYLATFATDVHDKRILGLGTTDDKNDKAPFVMAIERLIKCDDNCYGGNISRSHEFAYPDHTFELVLFPYQGRFYAIPITEDRDLLNVLKTQEWVEEFGYWDSTDPLETVTDDEWSHRQRVWDGIDSRCYAGVLFNGGFLINLSPRLYDYPSWQAVEPYVPAFEKRVSKHALSVVHAEWSLETYERLKADLGGSEPPIGSYVMGFGKARKEEPKWEMRIEEEVKRISAILPEKVTDGMLGVPAHMIS